MRHRAPGCMLCLFLMSGCAPGAVGSGAVGPDTAPSFPGEPPPPLEPAEFQVPEVSRARLKSGMEVLLVENHRVPLVTIKFSFNGGSWTDPAGAEGLASATMAMLTEGAGELDAMQISAALRRMGSLMDSGASLDGAWLQVSGMVRHLPETLDLAALVLMEPRFPEAGWELERRRRVERLEELEDDPNHLSVRAMKRILYGEGRYGGRSPSAESYGRMAREDLEAWWRRHMHPGRGVVLVGGAVTMDEVLPLLEERFGGWEPGERVEDRPDVSPPGSTTVYVMDRAGSPEEVGSFGPRPDGGSTTIYLLDRPGSPQGVVRVATFGPRPADADWFPMRVADMALGGMFTSRVNMNLREDKGWTYGARSKLVISHAPSRWETSTSIETRHVAGAVQEILREARRVVGDEPLTEGEVVYARDSMVEEWPSRFERTGYMLGQEERRWRYGLPEAWLHDRLDQLRAVTTAEANAALAAHLDPDSMVVVVVGDADAIRADLQATGLPLLEVTR